MQAFTHNILFRDGGQRGDIFKGVSAGKYARMPLSMYRWFHAHRRLS